MIKYSFLAKLCCKFEKNKLVINQTTWGISMRLCWVRKRKCKKSENSIYVFSLNSYQHLVYVRVHANMWSCVYVCIKRTEHGKQSKDNIRN